MIEQFAVMKPQKIDGDLPIDDKYVYQQKIDGGNAIIDVELPTVKIIHARTLNGKIIWNDRTYRYPELVREIRERLVLKDNSTYIGELSVLDEKQIGRHWLFLKRQLENNFQINRASKISPIVFFPHHIVRDGTETLFDLQYYEILKILDCNVKNGEHIRKIDTFDKPDNLLIQKGLIEGIVVKDKNGTYHKGKRGYGWFKKKFLKEKTVKFVSYENQEIGIKMFSEKGKPVHLAGNRVETVTNAIEEQGFVMCELEFYDETELGYRDCSVKRVLDGR